MSEKIIIHSLVLFCSVLVAFLWSEVKFLNYYSLQLAGVLIIFLMLARKKLSLPSFRLAESAMSTISVILIVTNTGGLTSGLFFLNHLLLFEMAFLLEPQITLVLTFLLILTYGQIYMGSMDIHSLITVSSLIVMTPLAYLLGYLYLKFIRHKKEINTLSHKIDTLKNQLLDERINHAQG